MKVVCQQQDILKIRDGIPGHGIQKVRHVCRKKDVYLACGCHLPFSWLPKKEQHDVQTRRPS